MLLFSKVRTIEREVIMKPDSDPLADYGRFKLTSAAEVMRIMYVGKGEDFYRVELAHSLTNHLAPYEVRCFRFQSLEDDLEPAHVYVRDFSAAEKTAKAALEWTFSKIGAASPRSEGENPEEPPMTKADFEANLRKTSRKKG